MKPLKIHALWTNMMGEHKIFCRWTPVGSLMTNATRDFSKVTCLRCLKWVGRDGRMAEK